MKVGLALGSGSARGFSHIGIIDCLLDQGIVPDVVAGTSIGAIVGACYASGHLERLRKQALAINRLNWTTFFNPSFSIDGWINLHQMQMFLIKSGVERKQKCIEDLQIPFGTVTCDLMSGKEIWITKGPVFDSVWPSMAMPGVFPPVEGPEGRWYIDGGIVNPVPVSLCRALGADVVIAVNLNNDLLRRVEIEKRSKGAHRKKQARLQSFLPKPKILSPQSRKKKRLTLTGPNLRIFLKRFRALSILHKTESRRHGLPATLLRSSFARKSPTSDYWKPIVQKKRFEPATNAAKQILLPLRMPWTAKREKFLKAFLHLPPDRASQLKPSRR